MNCLLCATIWGFAESRKQKLRVNLCSTRRYRWIPGSAGRWTFIPNYRFQVWQCRTFQPRELSQRFSWAFSLRSKEKYLSVPRFYFPSLHLIVRLSPTQSEFIWRVPENFNLCWFIRFSEKEKLIDESTRDPSNKSFHSFFLNCIW